MANEPIENKGKPNKPDYGLGCLWAMGIAFVSYIAASFIIDYFVSDWGVRGKILSKSLNYIVVISLAIGFVIARLPKRKRKYDESMWRKDSDEKL